MKKIILLLLIFDSLTAFSQNDKNGNPVFNSESIDEIKLNDDFKIVVNYYPLENNIENPLSSVFVSKKPSKKEIIKSATELMSYNLLLLKNQKMVDLIALNEKPKRNFNFINQKSGQREVYKSKIKGDISENRANEIIKNNYDENARIENNILIFNGKEYSIYSKNSVVEKAKKLIKANNHLDDKISNVQIPTSKELEKFIIKETKPKGKLDFFTEIEGKENNGVQIKPGVFTTLKSIALYKWGRANYEIGVNTYEDSFAIYSKIKDRDLNKKEKAYIKDGFNNSPLSLGLKH